MMRWRSCTPLQRYVDFKNNLFIIIMKILKLLITLSLSIYIVGCLKRDDVTPEKENIAESNSSYQNNASYARTVRVTFPEERASNHLYQRW